MTYICTTIGVYAKSVDYRVFVWFPNFLKTAKSICTGHVQPLALTYLSSQTYPANRT
jgi:hypothetical protein